MEVKGLKSLPGNKVVYCTMEVDGGDKLQTDQAEASQPWYVIVGHTIVASPLSSATLGKLLTHKCLCHQAV